MHATMRKIKKQVRKSSVATANMSPDRSYIGPSASATVSKRQNGLELGKEQDSSSSLVLWCQRP